MIFILKGLGWRYFLEPTGEEVLENIGECQMHGRKSAVLKPALPSH